MKSSKLALLLAVMIIGGIITPVVSAAPSITVVSPNGGDNWARGTKNTITWSSSGSTGANVKIELLKPGMLNRVITYSTPNNGSYIWAIPLTQKLGNDYKIKVTSTTNSEYTDTSNNYFLILAPITVASPNGGESWARGISHIIEWTYTVSGPVGYVKIELLKAGVLNSVINSSILNDGMFSWIIPADQNAGTDYQIRITSTANSAYTDTSNNNFTIYAPITVVSPKGGRKWTRGTKNTITWSSSGSAGPNVKIELLKPGMLNRVITYSTPNNGSYIWAIPLTQALGTDYKIRVTSIAIPAYTDTSNNFTIQAPITVISPNGGEKWTRGTKNTITWSYYFFSPGEYVKIELLKPGMLNRVITNSTVNNGSYIWSIPLTQTLGTDYKIRVTSKTNSTYKDTSDNDFTINAPITVVSPNGGESWARGTTKPITWNESGINCSSVKIELLKAGVLNRNIKLSTDDDGSYSWRIPSTQTLGSDYKIRVTCNENSAYTDTSNNNFTIRAPITVVSPDRDLYAWGSNSQGRLGIGVSDEYIINPVLVPNFHNVVSISASGHSIALKTDGTVWTWGSNDDGELGIGSSDNNPHPTPVQVFEDAKAVAAGSWHSIILKNNGTVWKMGDNGFNQGTNLIPVMVNGITDVIAISGGEYFSAALKSDGTVWTWGSNRDGELGIGTVDDYHHPNPVQVVGLDNVIAIATGGWHTLALKSDGTIWTWGSNYWGQLGIGGTDYGPHPTPVEIEGLDDVKSISAKGMDGSSSSFAVKTDGSVWAWGSNINGKLGIGGSDNNKHPTPVQANITDVNKVSAGTSSTMALKKNGTVWITGSNGQYELVSGIADIAEIAAGEGDYFALKKSRMYTQ